MVPASEGQGEAVAGALRERRFGLGASSAGVGSGGGVVGSDACVSAVAFASSLALTTLGRFAVVGNTCMMNEWRTSSDGTATKLVPHLDVGTGDLGRPAAEPCQVLACQFGRCIPQLDDLGRRFGDEIRAR